MNLKYILPTETSAGQTFYYLNTIDGFRCIIKKERCFMEKNLDENRQKEWLKEIALQTKSESYAAEEMISCKKCERKNPPTRLNCL